MRPASPATEASPAVTRFSLPVVFRTQAAKVKGRYWKETALATRKLESASVSLSYTLARNEPHGCENRPVLGLRISEWTNARTQA
jgi:hypothetical protein